MLLLILSEESGGGGRRGGAQYLLSGGERGSGRWASQDTRYVWQLMGPFSVLYEKVCQHS